MTFSWFTNQQKYSIKTDIIGDEFMKSSLFMFFIDFLKFKL